LDVDKERKSSPMFKVIYRDGGHSQTNKLPTFSYDTGFLLSLVFISVYPVFHCKYKITYYVHCPNPVNGFMGIVSVTVFTVCSSSMPIYTDH